MILNPRFVFFAEFCPLINESGGEINIIPVNHPDPESASLDCVWLVKVPAEARARHAKAFVRFTVMNFNGKYSIVSLLWSTWSRIRYLGA